MLAVANIGTTRAEFAGIAAGFELFGISRYASVPAAAVIVSLLVLRGSFHRVEHFLLLSTVSEERTKAAQRSANPKHRGYRP